jgi:mRNA interferase MazF
MGEFVKGDVVIVPFPFSDLSSSKRRPALVLAIASADDLILSQITSKDTADNLAIRIGSNDFQNGGLSVLSNARPNKLFTAGAGIIAYKAGHLKPEKTNEIVSAIVNLLSAGG